jgi:toxin FitB
VTRYLVDTNIISVAAPSAPIRHAEIIRWMDSHSRDLFLSAISVAETADSIAKVGRQGARRKAPIWRLGWKQCCTFYSERVLAFDGATARLAGALSDLARGRGHAPGLADVIMPQRPPARLGHPLAQRTPFCANGCAGDRPLKQLPSDK